MGSSDLVHFQYPLSIRAKDAEGLRMVSQSPGVRVEGSDPIGGDMHDESLPCLTINKRSRYNGVDDPTSLFRPSNFYPSFHSRNQPVDHSESVGIFVALYSWLLRSPLSSMTILCSIHATWPILAADEVPSNQHEFQNHLSLSLIASTHPSITIASPKMLIERTPVIVSFSFSCWSITFLVIFSRSSTTWRMFVT
ncbi:predicted protein [Lichtheimia corymbifera JMRC:FSU:9682]|uniref:Uncharacterized protein n=1 Tax=Lichtheimia corymbifera JMRC:FSU:9682 TaxID=1263082 RepID=A0A068RNK6_9FUNG|nr:predicted protein [Lichtheimia corymbifera JMRC:FSU:9682]